MELKCSTHIGKIGYEAYLNGDILSVLIYEETIYDYTSYAVYNLNVSTGNRLDTQALLEELGVSWDNYAESTEQILQDIYVDKYGEGAEFDPEFYQQQLEKTISDENVKAVQLFLGENGTVLAAADIYSIAGAEKYPQIVELLLPVTCS